MNKSKKTKKANKKQFVSLEKRIKKYKGLNLAKEFSWDEPKGKEFF